MPTFFSAHDGTKLAYHVFGDGPPVVCLPGGPMQASVYLGDLGGLSSHRQLIMLDLRGTGQSAIPDGAATYRCDRLVDDVDAWQKAEAERRADDAARKARADQMVIDWDAVKARGERAATVRSAEAVLGGVVQVSGRSRRRLLPLARGPGDEVMTEIALARERREATAITGSQGLLPALAARSRNVRAQRKERS